MHFLAVFLAFVGQPHGHIRSATSMPFASFNPTNPRTNLRNFHKKFWELAILKNELFNIAKSSAISAKISWIGPWVSRIDWCEGHWCSSTYMVVSKVIIEKSHGEMSPMGQDTFLRNIFEVNGGFIGQKILKLWRQESRPFGPNPAQFSIPVP